MLINDKLAKVQQIFGGQDRITGGAIFPTGGANAPPVKELKNALQQSATSWQQVCRVFLMEFGKLHDTTDTTPTYYWLVTDLI